MTDILLYIIFFLLGGAGGIIVGVKWLADKTVYNGKVKIKQRGKGNRQDPQINVEIDSREERRLERIKARLERKQARILKKSQK